MKTYIIALILIFAALSSAAQIEVSRAPRSSRAAVMPMAKSINIVAPPSLKAATIASKGRAYFGKMLSCDISFMQEATVQKLDGGAIYTLMLTSQGAYSIGIKTEGLAISKGSELYLYNNDREDVLGAIIDNQNTQQMRQIQGDTLNIELYVPNGVEQQDFRITQICYDYANAFGKRSKVTQYNSSCSSEVDINCDEGQAFQDVKHSTVMLSISDGSQSYLCTGTIVNNILCDQTPYILTAAHCVCEEETAEDIIFYFNYELPTCNSTSTPYDYHYMTGSTIVATAPQKTYTDSKDRTSSTEYPTMDFTLLRLNENIPDTYEPYYAGISTSETENMDAVAVIHHPQGDVKKISIAHTSPYQDSYPEEDKEVHYNDFCHWHVAQWDVGTTEGGSSGASMLNANKQVVGILSGGYADCNDPVDDYFQMISKAWDTYSSTKNQLKSVLAQGTHITEILPYNPLNINGQYLPAIMSAQVSADSTFAYLSWQQMEAIESKPKFSEDFDNTTDVNYLSEVFIANVDMDGDQHAWQMVTTEDSNSGDGCVASYTAESGFTNDYLTMYKISISSSDVLRFWAKSEGGVSTLTVSQNTKPSRYKQIASLDIDGDWQEYEIPLGDYAGSSIYINMSHVTEAGKSTAIYLDDISVDGERTSDEMPKVSGYEVYCNNQLVQSISDATIMNFDYALQRGSTYTFYVLNNYEDGATSGIGNSVVIDLDDTKTDTNELNSHQEPLVAYPNPTSGTIYITAPHNISSAAIHVYDITGRSVMMQNVSGVAKGEPIELSLAALRTGVYVIRLGGKTVKIQKQ
ncbi:MAG: choice-of-anchor J domain-containing protein [Bacteroidales bacterium]|nr:choice-of-anchor J domain-containing protein [Bacteroidales bacterium]